MKEFSSYIAKAESNYSEAKVHTKSIGICSIISLHVSVLLSAFLKFDFMLFRPVIASVYLSFAPGLLLLSISQIKLKPDRVIIYAVTLSWAFIIVLGIINSFVLNLSEPLSREVILLTLLISMTGIIVVYLSLYGFEDVHALECLNQSGLISDVNGTEAKLILYSVGFFTCCLVSTLILYNNYRLQTGYTVSILLASLFPVLVALTKSGLINDGPLKFSIVFFSVGLLYLRSLVSPYVNGFDIVRNLPHVRLTIVTSELQLQLPRNYANILTPHILAPFYHSLGGISVNVFYKYIVIAIFGIIIPLGLWNVYKKAIPNKYFNRQHILLSVLLVVFHIQFFVKMPTLVKQTTAEIFMITMVVVGIHNNGIKKVSNRAILNLMALLFAAGLVVSHYGTTWIFSGVAMIALIITVLAYFITKFSLSRTRYNKVEGSRLSRSRTIHYRNMLTNIKRTTSNSNSVLNFMFISPFVLFCLIIFSIEWYSRVGDGHMFEAAVIAVISVLLPSGSGEITGFVSKGATGVGTTGILILQLVTVVLVGIGLVSALLHLFAQEQADSETQFQIGYIAFTGCLSGLGVVYIFGSPLIGLPRYTHLLTLFAAPYAIIGILTLLGPLRSSYQTKKSIAAALVSVFLFVMLIFNAGMISAATDGSTRGLYGVEEGIVTDQDIEASVFLLDNSDSIDKIIGDRRVDIKFNGVYVKYNPSPNRIHLVGRTPTFVHLNAKMGDVSQRYGEGNHYIFFHSENMNSGKIEILSAPRGGESGQIEEVNPWNTDQLKRNRNSHIYDNGGSEIWKTR